MLELAGIKKEYKLKDQSVMALKGIDLVFRRNEFASILGPSGCGKTTLLNIIGGLDRYSAGDLIIDGVSTRQFKDKDWDNYRNHRVGFVFQSYNLIPHQTVLENVELALTLSGIKKKERRARAIEVLNKVGLGDKLKSKPNQLSGGQMQRVAIARALVNDPEIILADEPTGALDSKTSVQIMELLKEVSKDRLVIMVTHNPELAMKYSTRIVRFLDGELVEDSAPYSHAEAEKEIKKHKQQKQVEEINFKKTEKKKSMSFFTALGLSFKNMLTKKGRTLMVAFAGSIGIIGIALILATSAGMTGYINRMQSESLASYPISVTSVAVDLNSLQNGVNSRGERGEKVADDELSIYDMKEMLTSYGSYNYISDAFVEKVKKHYGEPQNKDLLNELKISYASNMYLITDYTASGSTMKFPISNIPTTSVLNGTTTSSFFEALENENYVRGLYDVIGNYPTQANELALVLNSRSVANHELQALGIETSSESKTIKLDTIINQKTYKLLFNDAYYNTDGSPKLNFESFNLENLNPIIENNATLTDLYNDTNTKELKITGALILKDDASGSIFSNGIMYSHALAEEYHTNCKQSTVVSNLKATILADKTATLKLPYKVNIVEIKRFMDATIYEFNTLQEMVNMLTSEQLNINLTDDELVDLYLQMYGASSVPTGIYFYCKSFEAKDNLTALIDDWNSHNTIKIVYNDSSQMLTNMLGTIVNIISYVLVAFAGISLVVSSIMIAIITYTSVIERTKEIGVLRSVGASKRDVSRVFNAETIIIGLLAGVIGIAISGLLSIVLSVVLKALTGVAGLVQLKALTSLVLIAISVLLTFVAGLIPAKIASKKDPVLALRTE